MKKALNKHAAIYGSVDVAFDGTLRDELSFRVSGENNEGLPLEIYGDGHRKSYDDSAVDTWTIHAWLPEYGDIDHDLWHEDYHVDFDVVPDDGNCYYDKNGEVELMGWVIEEWLEDNIPSYPDDIVQYYFDDMAVSDIMYWKPKTYDEFIERAMDSVGMDREQAEYLYEWARREWYGIPEKTSRRAMKKRSNRNAIAMKKKADIEFLWVDGKPRLDDDGEYEFRSWVPDTRVEVYGVVTVTTDVVDDTDDDNWVWGFDHAYVDMEIGVEDELDLYYSWLDYVEVSEYIENENDVLNFGKWLDSYLSANWGRLRLSDIDQEAFDMYDAMEGYDSELGEYVEDNEYLFDRFDQNFSPVGLGRGRMTHHASRKSTAGKRRGPSYPDDFSLTAYDIPDLDMWWPRSPQGTPADPYWWGYDYRIEKEGVTYYLSIASGHTDKNGDYGWYITPSPMDWPQITDYDFNWGVHFDTPQDALNDLRDYADGIANGIYAPHKSANLHKSAHHSVKHNANAKVRIAAHKLATAINGKELGEEIRDKMFNDDYALVDEIDYDAVQDLIYNEADQALMYYDDLWDTARLYADSSKVVELFMDEFIDDIFDGFGDIDEAVEEYNGSHREAKRRSARRRISGRKVRR